MKYLRKQNVSSPRRHRSTARQLQIAHQTLRKHFQIPDEIFLAQGIQSMRSDWTKGQSAQCSNSAHQSHTVRRFIEGAP